MLKSELKSMIREEIQKLNESQPVLKSLKDILKYLKDEYAHPNVKYTDVKFKEIPRPSKPNEMVWELDLKADGRPYKDFFKKDGDHFIHL